MVTATDCDGYCTMLDAGDGCTVLNVDVLLDVLAMVVVVVVVVTASGAFIMINYDLWVVIQL